MDDIHFAISNSHFKNEAQCVFADYNSKSKLIFRIRMNTNTIPNTQCIRVIYYRTTWILDPHINIIPHTVSFKSTFLFLESFFESSSRFLIASASLIGTISESFSMASSRLFIPSWNPSISIDGVLSLSSTIDTFGNNICCQNNSSVIFIRKVNHIITTESRHRVSYFIIFTCYKFNLK